MITMYIQRDPTFGAGLSWVESNDIEVESNDIDSRIEWHWWKPRGQKSAPKAGKLTKI